MLTDPLMQRALLAALLVGAAAPVVGTYLVQRRLALLGDGIGHVALTGVALGWLIGSAMGLAPNDVLAIPGAVVAAVIGSVLIEVVRRRGRTSGDLALAIMFYGGIAGGVLIIGIAGGSSGSLMSYLFGSISTVTTTDLVLTVVLCLLILVLGVGLRPALFSVSHDEEFAISSGLPVWALNMAVAVLAALTVTVAMRVVGLLLVSALMIVPVAIGQLVTHSFRRTMAVGSVTGVAVCVTGLSITYWYPLSPGALIVVLAIGVYALVAGLHPLLARRRPAGDPHPDIPDDVQVAARTSAQGDCE
ncbi:MULTISPECIES: metal ABC transporter permease [Isoptericola]|uniref:Metal ABC transporter permease n=1 Tax=Isoptericola sediminis TaxID=2733572 RepID=A0A849KIE4_9MICO|nr:MULTISPECIES: metal ABC transporter permease [Isoptericola]MDO8145328.1 metal ABC transporter permease [Isoptericola sp. 178]MDO8148969.1 metal ABC transporter permease [Isoptericola sp. b515]MDO8151091.1 metal ABC transporter permease [Isoptericola sp. b408]NNU28423.1 metal ABC transporter permease [Isoptericola sediminis]